MERAASNREAMLQVITEKASAHNAHAASVAEEMASVANGAPAAVERRLTLRGAPPPPSTWARTRQPPWRVARSGSSGRVVEARAALYELSLIHI